MKKRVKIVTEQQSEALYSYSQQTAYGEGCTMSVAVRRAKKVLLNQVFLPGTQKYKLYEIKTYFGEEYEEYIGIYRIDQHF